MAKTKQQKEEILKKLESIADKKSIVFSKFTEVSANETNSMRGEMKKEDVGFMVSKKTLFKKIFDGKSIKGEMPEIVGEVGLAYGDELTAPARLIAQQGKQFGEGKLSIIGGIFDGEYKNAEEMTVISKIPSREVLYSQFLAMTLSPLTQFTIILNEYAKTKE